MSLVRAHGLAAHAEDGYREWGVSGQLRLVPGGSGRGLSASLVPSWGVDPGGSERLWTMPDADALAANGDAPLSSRLDGEAGYGIAMFGERFTGTPNAGFGLSDAAREHRMGWRLAQAGGSFELGLDAVRRGPANHGGAPAEHGARLRVSMRLPLGAQPPERRTSAALLPAAVCARIAARGRDCYVARAR